MMAFPFLAVGLIMKVVAVAFVFLGLVLILVVLIQKGRGGGLSGALGGGMASGILGSKTGDFLTWVTVALVTLFLTFGVIVAKYYRPYGTEQRRSTIPPIEQQQQNPELPLDTGGAGGSNADANLLGK
jgi:preprotein translocase subunit SecG